MCTCIEMRNKDFYFGRNLDLQYRFGQKVAVTPRNYPFRLKNGSEIKTSFALIGMASVAGEYPLYAEASNEKGLSMAGLYFPGTGVYMDSEEGKLNLASFELIPYFLGQYESIDQIRGQLENLNITNIPFAEGMYPTELHWMISDGKKCVVLEQMADGLKIYENPIGVLTNNPPFYYHLWNIKNYMAVKPGAADNRFSDRLDLECYGNGMGSIGLPGDTGPASRFVRAAFNKWNSPEEESEEEAVGQFFHVLDSVAMTKGSTVTAAWEDDFTLYSCCINTDKRIYYCKTYTNNRIIAVKMTETNMNADTLDIYELEEKQQIKYVNS